MKYDTSFYKELEPPQIFVSSRIQNPIYHGYKGMSIYRQALEWTVGLKQT